MLCDRVAAALSSHSSTTDGVWGLWAAARSQPSSRASRECSVVPRGSIHVPATQQVAPVYFRPQFHLKFRFGLYIARRRYNSMSRLRGDVKPGARGGTGSNPRAFETGAYDFDSDLAGTIVTTGKCEKRNDGCTRGIECGLILSGRLTPPRPGKRSIARARPAQGGVRRKGKHGTGPRWSLPNTAPSPLINPSPFPVLNIAFSLSSGCTFPFATFSLVGFGHHGGVAPQPPRVGSELGFCFC
jgi:hypothetical protein